MAKPSHHPEDPVSRLIVQPGSACALATRDPRDTACFPDKKAASEQVDVQSRDIDRLQDALYAEGRRALLVILQGTDTSGKDGTIRKVFGRVGALGVEVTPFRRPSEVELAHDFLWRVHAACPSRGMVGIFNRSHYEDVLVAKVRALAPPDEIERRYHQINAFEKMLVENGTTILKFMLHISKDEQAARLRQRLEEPDKRWKFQPGDLDDRLLWDDFQAAYETALERCSTEWAPWYVIPADRKWARNATIAHIVHRTLSEMDPKPVDPGYRPEQFTI